MERTELFKNQKPGAKNYMAILRGMGGDGGWKGVK